MAAELLEGFRADLRSERPGLGDKALDALIRTMLRTLLGHKEAMALFLANMRSQFPTLPHDVDTGKFSRMMAEAALRQIDGEGRAGAMAEGPHRDRPYRKIDGYVIRGARIYPCNYLGDTGRLVLLKPSGWSRPRSVAGCGPVYPTRREAVLAFHALGDPAPTAASLPPSAINDGGEDRG